MLTKGIPIRIAGAPLGSCDEHSREPENTRGHPSVDSWLAALSYASLPGANKIGFASYGAVGCAYSNRYWKATELVSQKKFGGYLVARLEHSSRPRVLSTPLGKPRTPSLNGTCRLVEMFLHEKLVASTTAASLGRRFGD